MITESIDSFNSNYVTVCDAIKNSFVIYNNFYKLLYSNNYLTFNGVFILLKLNYSYIIKDKIFFDINDNYNIIDKINFIEENILNLLSVKKEKQLKLKEFMNNGIIKFSYSDYNNINNSNLKLNNINNSNLKLNNLNNNFNIENFILKISGIWENKDNIGITFKIINVKNSINI